MGNIGEQAWQIDLKKRPDIIAKLTEKGDVQGLETILNLAIKNGDLEIVKKMMDPHSYKLPPQEICMKIFEAFAASKFTSQDDIISNQCRHLTMRGPVAYYTLTKHLEDATIRKAASLVMEAVKDIEAQGVNIWVGQHNKLD